MDKKAEDMSWAEIKALFVENNKGIQELRESQKETDRLQKENAKQLQESHETWRKECEERDKKREESHETWRKEWKEGMQELRDIQKENAKRIKELSDNIGGVSNSNGRVAEEYFINSLKGKMEFAGIHFDEIETNRSSRYKIKTLKNNEQTRTVEFDIVMLNSSSVAIIEIKYKARDSDIEKLVDNKVKNFRNSHPQYKDFAIYLGLGSFSFDKYAVEKAEELGVGLLKQVGETVEYENIQVRAY